MKITHAILVLFTCSLISNCTPARIFKEDYPKSVKISKVKITREDSIIFMAVPAILGFEEKDRVSLWKGESAEINVPVGSQQFFVRSNQGDSPFKYTLEVKENEILCLKIYPETKPAIKFFLPLIFYFSNAFGIEKVNSCK